jgi:CheY-like chemotaxis protein
MAHDLVVPADRSHNKWTLPSAGTTRDQRPHNALDDHTFTEKMVLVVDDGSRNAFALSALLERGHADIAVAESGLVATALLERTARTDIVLMDILMPGMDGYETMRAIRTQERFKALPMIAVTGKVIDGERQRGLDAGANDFISKPVVTAQLLSAMGPWLTNSASNSQ